MQTPTTNVVAIKDPGYLSAKLLCIVWLTVAMAVDYNAVHEKDPYQLKIRVAQGCGISIVVTLVDFFIEVGQPGMVKMRLFGCWCWIDRGKLVYLPMIGIILDVVVLVSTLLGKPTSSNASYYLMGIGFMQWGILVEAPVKCYLLQYADNVNADFQKANFGRPWLIDFLNK